MKSKLLCTDVLAIRCIGNLIFVGMGSTLHIFNLTTYELERKISCIFPYNIYGIVEGPDNKLTVFGANFLCTYKIYREQGTLIVEENSQKKIFNDWIIAVKWLTHDECNYLCVLSAHNNICICDTSCESYQNISCEEKCILYSGSILVNDNKDLVIFSGTVYQEILIWEVNYGSHAETSSVLHRLQGHNGVIFSVIYDPLTQLICSTSDDRTVRLWKIDNIENRESNVINWRQADVKLLRTIFGHTARVWKAIVRNEILVTIGEDSLMCTWSLDGKLLNKIYAHHGAVIWSIDASDDNKRIFTGGADGAVHAWPFINNYIEKPILLPKRHTYTLPKYVCYLSSGNVLVFNESGVLFLFNRSCNESQETLYLERYSTYCVMEISLCRSFVCFASRDGYVTIYKECDVGANKLQQVFEERIMESQIFSVQWLESNKLVACGTNGMLKIFTFTTTGSVTVQSICFLPHSRERWLTAAVLYEGLLVCGDRAGNMHVFELEKSVSKSQTDPARIDNKPVQTFVKVHGKIGIQNFIVLDSKLISAGRDGKLRFYETYEHKNAKLLCTLHKEKLPMDWIGGHLKTSDDIFILGFQEVEFVIYSMINHRTLIRVSCGGGHRSWDCMLLSELITFIYIRNKQVYVLNFSLSSLMSPVLLNGFHTKEICCIKPVLQTDQQNIFISGGEDGTLRITYVSNTSIENNFAFRTLGIFDGHISSIKFVTCLNLESNCLYNKFLVFSGGGRAQIKVWEIDIKDGKTFLQSTDISCHDIASHMLYGFDRQRRKQWQESKQSYFMQPETRYMDIDIYRSTNYVLLFVACADGFIRIFLYDIDTKQISLKVHAKCVDRCITKITILTYEEKVIALAMSTDGIGRFFDFTDTISRIIEFHEVEGQEFQNCKDVAFEQFHLHQSGINSYDVRMIGNGEYLLITGGDDNLLNLIYFQVHLSNNENELHISVVAKWGTSSVHAAQIAGLKFREGNQFYSVGMDQQVIMYKYYFNNNFLSVAILKKVITFVADVKGLSLWYNSKGQSNVCVYGKGFEILIS